ncbi:MAG: hypothetical protein LBL91_01750 [Lachnospiraceae bacterium]|jgi:hypothetical protein|nr:hypothetical protein [Lachnospiraceae bacterium]
MLDFDIRSILVVILVLLALLFVATSVLSIFLFLEIRKRRNLEAVVHDFEKKLKVVKENYDEDIERLTESPYADTNDEIDMDENPDPFEEND